MPPKDYKAACPTGCYTTEETDVPVNTYQITYCLNGVARTDLVEATNVYPEDDIVEVWNGNTLLLLIPRETVKHLRNLTLDGVQ